MENSREEQGWKAGGVCVSVLKMNVQQVVRPRSSFNGFTLCRVEKDSSRMENSLQPAKSNPNTRGNAGGSIGGESESLSRDRLVYLTTCLIGHHVEVQVTNGSVFSGIFHASNADGDFGVVLKMARVTKDVSSRGQRAASDSVGKAPPKTLIIPAHALVQVVAKDVPITSNGQSNELQGGKQQEIMLDSYISQSRHVELGKELQPWMPDEDDLQCPELENIFDSPWTGSWDQFKVNETLFGVKSTFNEELYTTKLERGPQMRKLEEEALRIAREIEGEETHDLHLAEERSIYPNGNLDVDEETKYSSVSRGVDDSGYADEDVMLNSYDTQAPKGPAGLAFGRSFADVTSGKSSKGAEDGQSQSGSLSKVNEDVQSAESDELQEILFHRFHPPNVFGEKDLGPGRVGVLDLCWFTLSFSFADYGYKFDYVLDFASFGTGINSVGMAKLDSQSLWDSRRDGSERASLSSLAAKGEQKTSFGEVSEDLSGEVHVTVELRNPHERPGSSASSTSDAGVATSGPRFPAVLPSSSVSLLSSEKSTLNPNAKEFKLNPNAKSFMPSQSPPLRPVSPVNDGSFYYPAAMPAMPHMQGLPVGMGVGPSFAGYQPMLFNPQAAAMQSPQAYFPANGPQYGQPMILGHPRPVMFMPGYPTN
ncbi:hypothetical protein Cgig2_012451 [Carnegiea gigantea]|uniref:Sm domain-containing protein n=1 Tax=Carnegiea gigantea TaxID=171969 RepID=A0A9Q1KMM2_9CARY|nr:hypothetical protein Cgig2_012451 [Carnegiea gigantea]